MKTRRSDQTSIAGCIHRSRRHSRPGRAAERGQRDIRTIIRLTLQPPRRRCNRQVICLRSSGRIAASRDYHRANTLQPPRRRCIRQSIRLRSAGKSAARCATTTRWRGISSTGLHEARPNSCRKWRQLVAAVFNHLLECREEAGNGPAVRAEMLRTALRCCAPPSGRAHSLHGKESKRVKLLAFVIRRLKK